MPAARKRTATSSLVDDARARGAAGAVVDAEYDEGGGSFAEQLEPRQVARPQRGEDLELAEFDDDLDELAGDALKGLRGYVYVVDRELAAGGLTAFVLKCDLPVDIDELQRQLGGGRFLVKIKRIRDGAFVTSKRFSMFGPPTLRLAYEAAMRGVAGGRPVSGGGIFDQFAELAAAQQRAIAPAAPAGPTAAELAMRNEIAELRKLLEARPREMSPLEAMAMRLLESRADADRAASSGSLTAQLQDVAKASELVRKIGGRTPKDVEPGMLEKLLEHLGPQLVPVLMAGLASMGKAAPAQQVAAHPAPPRQLPPPASRVPRSNNVMPIPGPTEPQDTPDGFEPPREGSTQPPPSAGLPAPPVDESDPLAELRILAGAFSAGVGKALAGADWRSDARRCGSLLDAFLPEAQVDALAELAPDTALEQAREAVGMYAPELAPRLSEPAVTAFLRAVLDELLGEDEDTAA